MNKIEEISKFSKKQTKTKHHSVCEHNKDTLRPDLCQSFDLTWAAGERLSDHKEEVGVFYPLGVEQPTGDSDGYLASFIQRVQQVWEHKHNLLTLQKNTPWAVSTVLQHVVGVGGVCKVELALDGHTAAFLCLETFDQDIV